MFNKIRNVVGAIREGWSRKNEDECLMVLFQDDVDLSNAQLFASSSQGRYIPQFFAKNVVRENVTGVSDEDYKVLETGPDHEHYWDAWADVVDNATITDPKTGQKCFLHHDEDLWIVPNPDPNDYVTVLGIEFRKMKGNDFDGFAGADKGSYIGESDNAVLILGPDKETIYEIPAPPVEMADGTSPVSFQQRTWTVTNTI